MKRNFGLTRPAATGGGHLPPASRRVSTQYPLHSGNSEIPLPAGSLSPADPVLKRSDLAQALIDVSAVVVAFLLVSITAISVPLAVFLMVFASF